MTHPTPDSLYDTAKAIQLALGPVFLLTGIAGMLNVMTGRLSRIIDRGRSLTEKRFDTSIYSDQEIMNELRALERRRYVTSTGITMCSIAALLICIDIVTLFLEVMAGSPLSWIVGVLFAAAIIALIGGLSFFLYELHLSAKTIRIIMSRKK